MLYQTQLASPVVEDRGRLLPVKMKSIKSSDSEDEIKNIVRKANRHGDKISIASMQHSQGG